MGYRQLVIGLGPGQCGLATLANLLNQQFQTEFTYQQPPLLPWQVRTDRSQLTDRMNRWRTIASASLFGDACSSYLPYIESLLKIEPAAKCVCLMRPYGEFRDAMHSWIRRNYSLPVNHWCDPPLAAETQCPLHTRLFPQYPERRLDDGLRRYYEEYFVTSEQLSQRFPDHFRIFDASSALDTSRGRDELMNYLGIPEYVRTGTLPLWNRQEDPNLATARVRASADAMHPNDPRRCVILVPFGTSIVPQCDEALRELERRGYPVRRVGGYAAIDQGRNQMATDSLIDGYAETMWIDADVGFDPSAVDRLRCHHQPITCGIYSQKGRRALACHIAPTSPAMTFGPSGGVHEILYAATGFLHVRREVYLAVQKQLNLAVCNERFGSPTIPFFQPAIRPDGDGEWYLAEDYAFSDRVRRCGIRILADSTIRLWHHGSYAYGWEDAGREMPRFENFTLNFDKPETEPPVAP